MRDLNIAYGKRVNSKTWTNSTTSWDALCERLCHTAVTGETAAQYHAMTREERNLVKDRGGFVGGHLKNGIRKGVRQSGRLFHKKFNDKRKIMLDKR